MDWDLFDNIRDATPPSTPPPRTRGASSKPPVATATTSSRSTVPPGHVVINGRLQRIVDDRPSKITLHALPPEVIEHVFKFLSSRDVVAVAATCKYLREASLSECIWTEKIEREFGLAPECYRTADMSPRKFYINILYKYGWALGCWVRQVNFYGGLLKVVVQKGMLVGKEIIPPENPHFDQEVTFKDVFGVKLDSRDCPREVCLNQQFVQAESAVRRRRRVFSASRGDTSSEDVDDEDDDERDENKEEENTTVEDWDLFGRINSDGMEWEGDEKKNEEDDGDEKRRKEEEKKAPKPHGAILKRLDDVVSRKKDLKPSFSLECLCPQTHKRDFDDFRQEDNTFRYLSLTKYDTIRLHSGKFAFQRYNLSCDFAFDGPTANSNKPDPTPNTSAASEGSPGYFPLRPGVFKGTYGGHGIEFVAVEKKSPFEFEAVKLSGDPNVPFGQITFSGDLRDFLFPSEEDQLAIDRLKPVAPQRHNDPSVYTVPQPYRTPSDCFMRTDYALPDKCRARIKTACQVAEWGHHSPQFVDAHLVLFSQDIMALIILDIKSLVLFHRLSPETLALRTPSTKIWRPLLVLDSAAGGGEESGAGKAKERPKPRRTSWRWPPPKFAEALGDVDT